MIKKVVLQNFRKHENLELDFGPGLTVMRAPNEGGKSTVIEAILYALYGTRALRSPVDEVVTWNNNPNTLKVVLHYGDYTFSRSPKGAEVLQGGKVFVTGQNEVSNFATNLLGADVNLASRLMLANQGNLRGSLDAGPKATAMLIESLASFDLFDTLIERMQAKLSLGSPSLIEAALARSQEQLAALVPPAPVDEVAYAVRRADLTSGIHKCDVELKAGAEALPVAEAAHAAALVLNEAPGRVKADLAALERAQVDRKTQKQIAFEKSATAPSQEAVSAAEATLARAKGDRESQALYATFKAYSPPATVWDESLEALNECRRLMTEDQKAVAGRIATLHAEIKATKARINTETNCKLCGQDITHIHDRAATNALAQGQVDEMELELVMKQAKALELQAEAAQIEQITKADAAATELIRKLGAFVGIDRSQVPPLLTWSGAVPDGTDYVALQSKAEADVFALDRKVKEAAAALARYEVLTQQCVADEATHTTLTQKLASFEVVTPEALDELWKEVLRIKGVINYVTSTKGLGEGHLRELDYEYKAQKAAANVFETQRIGWLNQISQAEADLTTLAFNNGLLKKIRAARPIIADKLWGTVLAAVSSIFSTMRGVTSVVTKGGDGFTVNGQAIASLSGSTLDILGLAIRVALVRTFLPTCPFLVLDEPAAGCDADRTAAMLGFISSCNFNQVLLITHENISESSANNLITL